MTTRPEDAILAAYAQAEPPKRQPLPSLSGKLVVFRRGIRTPFSG
jgi:hypothetical protein